VTRYLAAAALAVLVALRLWRRARRSPREQGTPEGTALRLGPATSSVGLIAARELRERLRGRALRLGTLLILAVVAAAIVIPTLTSSASGPERVGTVGTLTAAQRAALSASAASVGTKVVVSTEPDLSTATAALRAGRLDVAVVQGRALLAPSASAAANDPYVQALAANLGFANAIAAAGLSPSQAAILGSAKPVAVASVQKGPAKPRVHGTSIFGLVLVFVMLSQYNTWILIGVLEEKTSRVVEVLLAAVRPVQLLAGKVLGIGLVAVGQATLIVGFALIVARLVGSDLLRGTAPLTLLATLAWLLIGYAFYCWVYAAAGSMVSRQDQVQSIAFPLSLPVIFGYVMAILAVSEGSASLFVKVLAYLPPTAPFAMPVLVSLGEVTWWGFVASVAISIACTVLVARIAASIYRRAILRTGRRVRLAEVLSSRHA